MIGSPGSSPETSPSFFPFIYPPGAGSFLSSWPAYVYPPEPSSPSEIYPLKTDSSSSSPDSMSDEEPVENLHGFWILGLSDPNDPSRLQQNYLELLSDLVKLFQPNYDTLSSDPEQKYLELVSDLVKLFQTNYDILGSDPDLLELKEKDAQVLYPLLCWYAIIIHGKLPLDGQLERYTKIVGVDSLIQLLICAEYSKSVSSWTLEGLSSILSQKMIDIDTNVKRVLNRVLGILEKNCNGSEILRKIYSHFEFKSMNKLSRYLPAIEKLDLYYRLRWRVFVILASKYLIIEDQGMTAQTERYPVGIPNELLGLVKKIEGQIPILREKVRVDYNYLVGNLKPLRPRVKRRLFF